MIQITEDMLTDWFPPDVKPVHVGHYQIGYATERTDDPYTGPVALAGRRAVWNGANWQHSWAALTDFDAPLSAQDRPWRGLKEPYESAQEG